jgi:uncharacterized membrane protein YphA (DoxX/SURF4 family)
VKARNTIYWTVTVVLAFCILSGGAAEAVHYQANVEGVVVRLGYPLYFLTIIGIWKVLGAVVILVPRFPRLKEWAYAGIFFNVTGAAASHAAVGDYGPFAFHVVVNLVFGALVIVSWASRSPSRVIGGDALEKWWARSAEASAVREPA